MQKQYRAPSPGIFRRQRTRFFDSAALGITRLAAKLVAILFVGLAILYVVTLRQAAIDEVRADAVLEALLVKADTIAAAIEGAGVGEPLVALVPAQDDPSAQDDQPAQDEPAAADDPAAAGGITAVTGLVDRDAVERVIVRALEGSSTRARLYGVRRARPPGLRTALALRHQRTRTSRPPPAAPSIRRRPPRAGTS